MAEKFPLVLGPNGEPEELQLADKIPAEIIEGEVPDILECVADGVVAARKVVFAASVANDVGVADASDAAKIPPFGLAVNTAADNAAVEVQRKGKMGGFTGLTPGARQYLDPANPGDLTETRPTGSGEFVVVIGIAKNATDLIIDIKTPYRLR